MTDALQKPHFLPHYVADDDFRLPDLAPMGAEWLCMGCGKRSRNRVEGGTGWDEACFVNAVLVRNGSSKILADDRAAKLDACVYEAFSRPASTVSE